eukprot:12501227-Prorocentrum_lima.AAC.1
MATWSSPMSLESKPFISYIQFVSYRPKDGLCLVLLLLFAKLLSTVLDFLRSAILHDSFAL